LTQVGDVQAQLLPLGVSEEDFARALESFTATVGAERVPTSAEDLAEFRDPFAFAG
jgi:hypothetical protein